MLTLKLISEETERVIKGLERNTSKEPAKPSRRYCSSTGFAANASSNSTATSSSRTSFPDKSGGLMKEGKKDEANEIKNRVAELKTADKTLQEQMDEAQASMTEVLLTIPNIPSEEVPEGRDASDNVVVKEGGQKPSLGREALCHWDLCKKYNLVDFDLGVKITGAGFPIYIGKMARFQRALEAFFLDEARKSGYLEIQPAAAGQPSIGTGHWTVADKEGQMYHAQLDDLYLIPTAEVP